MDLNNNSEELKYHLLKACHVLRDVGIRPAEYADYVLPLLFLKCLSDIRKSPEFYLSGPDQRFPLFYRLHDWPAFQREDFYHLLQVQTPLLGERIDRILRDVEDRFPNELGDSLTLSSFSVFRRGDESWNSQSLSHLLTEVSSVSPNFALGQELAGADVFTIAIETLLPPDRAGFISPPTQVSRLVAQLVQPRPTERVCDPFSSAGSLLMACARECFRMSGEFPGVFGTERNTSAWAVSRMSAFLHGCNGADIRHARPYVLSENIYQVAVCFPPFGGKVRIDSPHPGFLSHRLFLDRETTTSSEYAPLAHVLPFLDASKGRFALVMPTGSLSKSGGERALREKLIDENFLEAVIDLPAKLLPGTPVPISILIIKPSRYVREVLFVNATHLNGMSRGRNDLSTNAIERIVATCHEFIDVAGYARRVDEHEIAKNDFNLQAGIYVDSTAHQEFEEGIDNPDYFAERMGIQGRLSELDKNIDDKLQAISKRWH